MLPCTQCVQQRPGRPLLVLLWRADSAASFCRSLHFFEAWHFCEPVLLLEPRPSSMPTRQGFLLEVCALRSICVWSSTVWARPSNSCKVSSKQWLALRGNKRLGNNWGLLLPQSNKETSEDSRLKARRKVRVSSTSLLWIALSLNLASGLQDFGFTPNLCKPNNVNRGTRLNQHLSTMGIQGCQSKGRIRLFCWNPILTLTRFPVIFGKNSTRLDTDVFVDGSGMKNAAVPQITAQPFHHILCGFGRTTLPDHCSKNLICTWTRKTPCLGCGCDLGCGFDLGWGLLSARTCWCQHKIHSKVQMPKLSTDSCWCLHKTSLSVHSGQCPRLYISSGHFAQLQISYTTRSYKGIFSKKCWKNAKNELYSKGHIRFANPSALAFFKLYEHGPFQVVPCEYRSKDLLGRAIFRRVLSDFAHACNRQCMEGEFLETSVLEVQWSIDSLWRGSLFQVSELWHTCSKRVFLSMTKQVTSAQNNLPYNIW